MLAVKLLIFLTVVASALGADQDLSHLCDALVGLDCKLEYIKDGKDEVVCGSDGQTYENFCYYSEARCADHSMVMLHTGPCETATTAAATTSDSLSTDLFTTTTDMTTVDDVTTTTAMTSDTTMQSTTLDPLLVIFCKSKDSITCSQDLEPICGSDKRFYLNQE